MSSFAKIKIQTYIHISVTDHGALVVLLTDLLEAVEGSFKGRLESKLQFHK